MKLLFDQNLSFKLCQALADIFPDSSQVRLLSLAEADDRTVWQHAKANAFVLVTHDSDFADMAALYGQPRKSSGSDAATNPPRPSRNFSVATPRQSPLSNKIPPPPASKSCEPHTGKPHFPRMPNSLKTPRKIRKHSSEVRATGCSITDG
jgi:hypothetical protein